MLFTRKYAKSFLLIKIKFDTPRKKQDLSDNQEITYPNNFPFW